MKVFLSDYKIKPKGLDFEKWKSKIWRKRKINHVEYLKNLNQPKLFQIHNISFQTYFFFLIF